jgi:hypothetical protein
VRDIHETVDIRATRLAKLAALSHEFPVNTDLKSFGSPLPANSARSPGQPNRIVIVGATKAVMFIYLASAGKSARRSAHDRPRRRPEPPACFDLRAETGPGALALAPPAHYSKALPLVAFQTSAR